MKIYVSHAIQLRHTIIPARAEYPNVNMPRLLQKFTSIETSSSILPPTLPGFGTTLRGTDSNLRISLTSGQRLPGISIYNGLGVPQPFTVDAVVSILNWADTYRPLVVGSRTNDYAMCVPPYDPALPETINSTPSYKNGIFRSAPQYLLATIAPPLPSLPNSAVQAGVPLNSSTSADGSLTASRIIQVSSNPSRGGYAFIANCARPVPALNSRVIGLNQGWDWNVRPAYLPILNALALTTSEIVRSISTQYIIDVQSNSLDDVFLVIKQPNPPTGLLMNNNLDSSGNYLLDGGVAINAQLSRNFTKRLSAVASQNGTSTAITAEPFTMGAPGASLDQRVSVTTSPSIIPTSF